MRCGSQVLSLRRTCHSHHHFFQSHEYWLLMVFLTLRPEWDKNVSWPSAVPPPPSFLARPAWAPLLWYPSREQVYRSWCLRPPARPRDWPGRPAANPARPHMSTATGERTWSSLAVEADPPEKGPSVMSLCLTHLQHIAGNTGCVLHCKINYHHPFIKRAEIINLVDRLWWTATWFNHLDSSIIKRKYNYCSSLYKIRTGIFLSLYI